jgi:hypothetical protein
MNSKNHIVKEESIPDCGIIFMDRAFRDPSGIQARSENGKIRLCEVSLPPSMMLDSQENYDRLKEMCHLQRPYRDYQWECRKHWYLFVGARYWDLESLAQTGTGKVRFFSDGSARISISDPAPWEHHAILTKQEAKRLITMLDRCQKAACKMLPEIQELADAENDPDTERHSLFPDRPLEQYIPPAGGRCSVMR